MRHWILLSTLLAIGCKEKLEDRFFKCRDLVADTEQRDESLKCFTAGSRPMLQALLDQKKETGSTLDYLEDYRKLLDYDDVIGAPDIQGNVALLVVTKKKEQATLTFVLEDDEWRMNPTDIPAFWRRLDEAVGAK